MLLPPLLGFFVCEILPKWKKINKKEIICYNIPMFLKKMPVFEENYLEFFNHIWTMLLVW